MLPHWWITNKESIIVALCIVTRWDVIVCLSVKRLLLQARCEVACTVETRALSVHSTQVYVVKGTADKASYTSHKLNRWRNERSSWNELQCFPAGGLFRGRGDTNKKSLQRVTAHILHWIRVLNTCKQRKRSHRTQRTVRPSSLYLQPISTK